jgi:hypothetical protein
MKQFFFLLLFFPSIFAFGQTSPQVVGGESALIRRVYQMEFDETQQSMMDSIYYIDVTYLVKANGEHQLLEVILENGLSYSTEDSEAFKQLNQYIAEELDKVQFKPYQVGKTTYPDIYKIRILWNSIMLSENQDLQPVEEKSVRLKDVENFSADNTKISYDFGYSQLQFLNKWGTIFNRGEGFSAHFDFTQTTARYTYGLGFVTSRHYFQANQPFLIENGYWDAARVRVSSFGISGHRTIWKTRNGSHGLDVVLEAARLFLNADGREEEGNALSWGLRYQLELTRGLKYFIGNDFPTYKQRYLTIEPTIRLLDFDHYRLRKPQIELRLMYRVGYTHINSMTMKTK